MSKVIRAEANWDPEVKVWVPLVTEAPTVEDLLAKLPSIIQDLFEDDRQRTP